MHLESIKSYAYVEICVTKEIFRVIDPLSLYHTKLYRYATYYTNHANAHFPLGSGSHQTKRPF